MEPWSVPLGLGVCELHGSLVEGEHVCDCCCYLSEFGNKTVGQNAITDFAWTSSYSFGIWALPTPYGQQRWVGFGFEACICQS